MQLIDLDFSTIFPYKRVFNPSIIPDKDGNLLMICRLQDHPAEGFLGICRLDKDLRPMDGAKIVRTSSLEQAPPEVMLEDPRLFAHNGEVYIYQVEASASFLYFCYTVFGRLNDNGSIQHPALIDHGENYNCYARLKQLGAGGKEQLLPQQEWLIEKNWQFFLQESRKFCIYKAGPKHEVFQFDYPGAAVIRKYITYNNIKWDFGRISGGAAPILHKDGYYYSYFHSWTKWEHPTESRPWLQRRYHVGLYIFESTPPFRIVGVSEKPLLSGDDEGGLAESGHSVVFPGSAFFDEQTNEWTLAIGWNDHSCKLFRIDHQQLVSQLRPVQKLGFPAIANMRTTPIRRRLKNKAGKLYRLLMGRKP